MQPRIMGTEMEWGLMVQPEKGENFILRGDLTPILDHRKKLQLNNLKDFLSNGARLYQDYGTHIEYATPEDNSIEGAVANEIAGERIVYNTCQLAKEDGLFHDFRLNKRLIDDEGNTWGHHENFSARKNAIKIDRESLALLGLHLATVSIFTGAGMVENSSDNGGRFAIAQKVFGLEEDYCSNTTGKGKPVVNLRNEPLGEGKWLRIHVTSGDANMSPWAIRMRLGTIALVLRLSEQKDKRYNPQTSPILHLHQIAERVARDLTLKETVQLQDGTSWRPLDIQGELIETVKEMAEKYPLPPEEADVLSEWERAHDDLKKDPELLADRADWVAKKMYLEQFMNRHKVSWGSKKVKDLDKLWDKMGPNGIGLKLREKSWSQWMPPEELIQHRETNPPETTRAIIRGRFINHFAGIGSKDAGADWHKLHHKGECIKLNNPFATKHPRVEQILAA